MEFVNFFFHLFLRGSSTLIFLFIIYRQGEKMKKDLLINASGGDIFWIMLSSNVK
jgi:hypothetical protein